jgi:hypothetical protein
MTNHHFRQRPAITRQLRQRPANAKNQPPSPMPTGRHRHANKPPSPPTPRANSPPYPYSRQPRARASCSEPADHGSGSLRWRSAPPGRSTSTNRFPA